MKTTNPLAGEFSPTGLETYMSCPRKFYIGKRLQLVAKDGAIALDFGAAFHSAIAAFYKGEDDLKKLMELFLADFPMRGDSTRNPQNAMVLIHRYTAVYSEYRKKVRKEEVEIPFEVAMPNGTLLCGVIDHILRDGNTISVVDTKTTGSPFTDYFWNRYSNSFQMGAYDYVCRQLLGECTYITIDGINLKKAGGGDGETFSRRSLSRTEVQRAEWLNTYLLETSRVMEALKNPDDAANFPQRPTSCTMYGQCEYLGLCRHGLDHPSVLVEMEKRTGKGDSE